MITQFVDFRLIVSKVRGAGENEFVVAVADAPISPWGYAMSRIDRSRLEDTLDAVEGIEVVRGAGREYSLRRTPAAATTGGARLRDVGENLFKLLFPEGSDVFELYGRSCMAVAGQAHKPYLRLKLELPPELSGLPWELMVCPLGNAWAKDIHRTRVSTVRFMGNISDVDKPGDDPWRLRGKPTVVIVLSDPAALSRGSDGKVSASFFRELIRVQKVLGHLRDSVDYELISERSTRRTLEETVESLEGDGRPVVGLHFIGHGGVDQDGSYFVGQDDDGEPEKIDAVHLVKALESAESLRWVLFNACSVAHEPIGCPLASLATSVSSIKNVPTVIAFKRPVPTADAEMLAADFYERVLGQSEPIEAVLRSVQQKYENPGALVVLVRSMNGLDQVNLELDSGDPAERGGVDARVDAPPAGGGEPRANEVEAPRGEMILVPAGPFWKGLTAEQIDALIAQFSRRGLALDLKSARETLSKERRTRVELPDFYMDRTPVTNRDFGAFVRATGYRTEAERNGDAKVWLLHDTQARADHPVVHVAYADALAYCRWADKRLPTTDEWKKAYRGEDSRIYPWGERFDLDRCNSAENHPEMETTPVQMFANGASPYGFLDMVGNVEEWTSGVDERDARIVMGASWCMTCEVYGLPVLGRVASQGFSSNELGFRCARDA